MDAALAGRLTRLERVARLDRAFFFGALVFGLATAQAPAPLNGPVTVGGTTIASTGIIVRNTAGVTRLDLGIDRNGYPSVDEYDTTGALRQAMYLLHDSPTLRQFDAAEKKRAELFLGSDTQNGEYVILDAAQTVRLGVFIGAQGLPELGLYGSDGKARGYLAADDGGGYLVMKDANATSRVDLGAFSGGTFGVDVRNAAGTVVWTKP